MFITEFILTKEKLFVDKGYFDYHEPVSVLKAFLNQFSEYRQFKKFNQLTAKMQSADVNSTRFRGNKMEFSDIRDMNFRVNVNLLN